MRMIIQIIVRAYSVNNTQHLTVRVHSHTFAHVSKYYTRYGYRVPTWLDADLEGFTPSKVIACRIINNAVPRSRLCAIRRVYEILCLIHVKK